MGVAYTDDELKTGIFYPAVALLHCAGCKIRGGVPVPSWFS
jgi:E3 ubiquitin-protein ligase NRDP1